MAGTLLPDFCRMHKVGFGRRALCQRTVRMVAPHPLAVAGCIGRPRSAEGRQHSVTKGRFWEAKPQRQLYGDEFGTMYFASRP